MDPNIVRQIKKGVTTRAEVEFLLGPPTSVSILDQGRRSLAYVYGESQYGGDGVAKSTGALYALGFLGSVAGVPGSDAVFGAAGVGSLAGGQEDRMRIQHLSVVLDANGVVEDYELSDGTTVTTMSPLGSGQTVLGPASAATSTDSKDIQTLSQPAHDDPAARLNLLKELRESGVLSEEEYQTKRKATIEGL